MLNAGHQVGTIEAAEVVEHQENAAGVNPLNKDELVPGHLSPLQQCQLMHLLGSYRDIFSRNDDDIGQTLCSSTLSRHRGHL